MIILFTDLDGTLLDHDTYSIEGSEPGIKLLKEHNIPLVLVSSKTRAEMSKIHKQLRLDSPFVFENGGGISFPNHNKLILRGFKTERLKPYLPELRKLFKAEILPITDMDINEIVERTGLDPESASLARKRETSIPFIPGLGKDLSREEIQSINLSLKNRNIMITRGGRFYHLIKAGATKGAAVRYLIQYYQEQDHGNPIQTAAVGDSENDIAMLEQVRYPFLVRKKNGTAIDTGMEHLYIVSKPGPEGFSEAVKILLKDTLTN